MFYGSGHALFWFTCHGHLQECVFHSCWMEKCCIYVNYILFGGVEFFYILTDFSLVDLSLVQRRVWKYSTIILDLSIFPFSFITFCFTYFAALLFGAYARMIGMSSWWIDLVIIMWCPFLSLAIFFALKSTLVDINITTSAFL